MTNSFIISSNDTGNRSPLSAANILVATPTCFRLLMLLMRCALDFALLNAGNNIAARIAMIEITTSVVINPLTPRRAALTTSAMNNATSKPTPTMPGPTSRSTLP